MLISVHMPKTAGTSFTESLRGYFGDALQLVYTDRPLHHTARQRNARALTLGLRNALRRPGDGRIACIHGHFLPLAYRWSRPAPGPTFVTWLRDPVERLASHYEHWKRVPDPPASDTLHRRMLDEAWTFEAFALRPELRNIYSLFLWGFPLERFRFVGISEDYERELAWFGEKVLGHRLESAHAMANPRRKTPGYEIDPALRRRIEAFHARDIALYRKALALQAQRHRGS